MTNNSAKCAIVQQLHQFNTDAFNVKYCTNIQSVLIIVQGNRTLFTISLQCMHMHIQCILFRAFDCIRKKKTKMNNKAKACSFKQKPIEIQTDLNFQTKTAHQKCHTSTRYVCHFYQNLYEIQHSEFIVFIYLFIKFPYLIVRARIV